MRRLQLESRVKVRHKVFASSAPRAARGFSNYSKSKGILHANGLAGPAVTEPRTFPDGIRIKLGRMWSAGPSRQVSLMATGFFTRRGFPGVLQCLIYSQCRNLYSKALPRGTRRKAGAKGGVYGGCPGQGLMKIPRNHSAGHGIPVTVSFTALNKINGCPLTICGSRLAAGCRRRGDVNSMRRLEGCLQEARQPIAGLPSAEPAVIYVLKKRTGFTVLGLRCQHK